jgi:hypothetical protein
MTDTYELSTNDPFITTLVDKWFASKAVVEAKDAEMKIESLGKSKLLNEVYNSVVNAPPEDDQTENIAAQFAATIREMLDRAAKVTDEDRPGSFFAGMMEVVKRTLNDKEYDDKLEAFTKEHVVVPKEGDKPSDTEMETLRKERKTAVDNMNGIRSLLEGTAPDWFTTEGKSLLLNEKGEEKEWTNLRGAIGKRGETGVRLPEYSYTVDGTNLTEKKLGAVRDHINKTLSIGDVRKSITDQVEGFDFKNPPEKFEFDLLDKDNNSHHVVARKVYTTTSTEDDSSDDLNLEITTEVNEEGETESPEVTTFDDDDE